MPVDDRPVHLLNRARVVVWDFDGVIKESNDVKTAAYVALVQDAGAEVTARVRAHHEANTGVARSEKIPLYLAWAGGPVTEDRIRDAMDAFARRVRQAVIDAPWVPGVAEYIREHSATQCFAIASATPQAEMREIVAAIGLGPYVRRVHGSPTAKQVAIAMTLADEACPPDACVMVGDSRTDLAAARGAGVMFILRRTPLNGPLQAEWDGPAFDDLAGRSVEAPEHA